MKMKQSASKMTKLDNFFVPVKSREPEVDQGNAETPTQEDPPEHSPVVPSTSQPAKETEGELSAQVEHSDDSDHSDEEAEGPLLTLEQLGSGTSPSALSMLSEELQEGSSETEAEAEESSGPLMTTGHQGICQSKCCTANEPYHPSPAEIKETSVTQNTGKGKNAKRRLCPHSVFGKYPWITYCLTKGTISCYFCKRAKTLNLEQFSHCGEEAFCTNTFADWKKCHEKFIKHEKCQVHSEAVMKVKHHQNPKVDVGCMLDKQLKSDQEIRRASLLKQLSSMRYLGRQGIGIRGHTEDQSNLHQLLKTRSEDVPYLLQWIKEGKYLSHDIINELYEMMANTLLREVLNDVRKSKWYSIMADESRDISNKEQMVFIIRWLSEDDFEVHEDFIGMYHLSQTDSETIAKAIKDILIRCNLDLANCRWQGYDGAATMSGVHQGVAARLTAENPAAQYLHCANHCLDLALQGSCKQNLVVKNAMDFVQELSVFIKGSPKRMEQYQQIAKDYDESETIHVLCPTRWTVRTRSINAVLNSYKAINETLKLIESDTTNREVKDKAAGLQKKMESFHSYFCLQLARNVFSVCEKVATTLQGPTMTPQSSMKCIEALLTNLQSQRDEFNNIFTKIQQYASKTEITGPPTLPRQRNIPRRLQHGNADNHAFTDVKDYYRVLCTEVMDVFKEEIKRRFDQPSYQILCDIEKVIMDSANGKAAEFQHAKCKDLYNQDIDFKSLERELTLLSGFVKQDVKCITSIDTVVSKLVEDATSGFILPNVTKLLHIYLLAPMSIAAGERSFSVQRRIKSYTRNAMADKRYNNLLVLHMHKKRTDKLDLLEIAKQFVTCNDRRMKFFGKF